MADAKETVWITADNSKLIKGLKDAEQQTVKSAKKMEQASKGGFGGMKKGMDATVMAVGKVFLAVKALEGAFKVAEGFMAASSFESAKMNRNFDEALKQYDKMKASFAAIPGLGPVIGSIWNIAEAISGTRVELERLQMVEAVAKKTGEAAKLAQEYFDKINLSDTEKQVYDLNRQWDIFNWELKVETDNRKKTITDLTNAIKEYEGLQRMAQVAQEDRYKKNKKLLEAETKDLDLARAKRAAIQGSFLDKIKKLRDASDKKAAEALEDEGDLREQSFMAEALRQNELADMKIALEKKVAEEKKRIAIETQEWISAQLIGDLKARLEKELKAKAAAQKAASDSDKFQLKRVSLSTAGFQTAGMRTQEDRKDQEKIAREKRIEKLQEEININTRDTKNALQVLSRGGASSNVARFNEP